MKKNIIIVFIVFILLISVAVIYTLKNLDSMVEKVIESVGTEVLGVPVSIDKMQLNLKNGSAKILGFEIENPEGFDSQPAIQFGEIEAEVNYSNYSIEKIMVFKPMLRLQQKGLSSNFNQILDHLKQNTKQNDSSIPSKEKPNQAADSQYQIHQILIEDIQLILKTEKEESKEIQIENIHFENLEGTAKELIGQIFSQILNQSTKSMGKNMIQKSLKGFFNKE